MSQSKLLLYGIVGIVILLFIRAFATMRIGEGTIAPSKVRVTNLLDVIGSPAPQRSGTLAPPNRALDSPLQAIGAIACFAAPCNANGNIDPRGDPGRTLDPGFGGFGSGIEFAPGFEVS